MSPSTKRILSTIAIVIASVAFGILISADLGLMRKSKAQSATDQSLSAPSGSVTIPSFADVASRVMPAVVSIRSTEIVTVPNRQFMDPFEFFFNDPRSPNNRRRQPQQPQPDDDDENQQRETSGGSGFIISADGYILTNNHVIENASKVEVHYGADENGAGGQSVPATIVGRDPATDIALLKIDVGQQLPWIRLGDSDRIRKGDWAIAIGHPFRFENTLTVGVISAKGRSLGLSQDSSFENFIQTDAAINFGNSGGPLLNIAGEVIAINTAIRGGGAQGIGFATPINTAKTLLPQLKQGKVVRAYIGVNIADINEEYREAFNLTEARGALVLSVTEGAPAARAGIRHGDVIVEVDGKPIRNNRELIDYISYLPVGTEVKVAVIRNGQRQIFNVKTAQRTTDGDEAEETTTPAEPVRDKLGMTLQNLNAQTRTQYGIPESITAGVVVVNVKDVSPAGEANMNAGDVITEVQGQPVKNLDDFRAAIDKIKSGQRIRLYVTAPLRDGRTFSTYRILRAP
ncbi:MAG TPA: Do family serine endopeptidase [Thermoanaerobaculia bacterium]|nr:Do family serine endopeptidase [Thermoanaerobaculia bacterium]